ncbi:hypothetical protein CI610_01159 [invertebrate metagenome]|uniref:Uncharacterized protein n=1 Tax=invertebrate metagenome TaxID=1711999 RepID=A0A2H9T9E3_9ZZZZ
MTFSAFGRWSSNSGAAVQSFISLPVILKSIGNLVLCRTAIIRTYEPFSSLQRKPQQLLGQSHFLYLFKTGFHLLGYTLRVGNIIHPNLGYSAVALDIQHLAIRTIGITGKPMLNLIFKIMAVIRFL